MALAAASLWKQVLGVQATLLNEEPITFLQNREQKVLTQVFRAGWISDYADPFGFLELFRTGHGRNDFGYSNELYDSLLDEIASERIPARRRRLMYEAERILLAEMPSIPVYTYVTKRLVNPRLQGWESNIMDHHYSKSMFLLKTAIEGEQSKIAETEDNAEPAIEAPAGDIPAEDVQTQNGPAEKIATESEAPDKDTMVPVDIAEDEDKPEEEVVAEDPPE